MTIATRVGRLLGRNTRAAALFDVQVEADASGFARLRWSKVEAWREWARLSEGCYVLRSNVTDWSPEDLWRAYIQLTEAEAAFRIHKSDLAIRPVWHQKEHRVQAHILVCFLTYVLWKTLAASCRQAGLGDEPRQVFEALSEIALVDVVLPTRSGNGDPQALHQPAHRASADLAPAARPETAQPRWNKRQCSGNSPMPPLKPKTLFFKLRKLG